MTKAKTLSLEQVRNNFTAWRNNKTYRYQAIPQKLWSQALPLLKSHSIKDISNALDVSKSQIQRELKRQPKLPRKPNRASSTKFVEFKIPPINTINNTTLAANSSKIELKKADGAALIIEQPSVEIVTLICSTFLGVVKC